MLKKKIDPERIPHILANFGIEPDEPYLMVNIVGDKADIVYSGTARQCIQWLSDTSVGIPDDECLYTHMMSGEYYATLDLNTLDN